MAESAVFHPSAAEITESGAFVACSSAGQELCTATAEGKVDHMAGKLF